MKLSLIEFFFQPEIAKGTDKHHVRRGDLKKSFNNFPYIKDDRDQRVSEEQIDKELELDGEI